MFDPGEILSGSPVDIAEKKLYLQSLAETHSLANVVYSIRDFFITMISDVFKKVSQTWKD